MPSRTHLAAAGAALGAALVAAAPALAYEVVQNFAQSEQRAPDGRLLVEDAIISVVNCTGPDEGGGQFYIYLYVDRPGVRAILPPNWASPIGGRDFATFEEAVAAACRSRPAPPPNSAAAAGNLTGRWGDYEFVQIGSNFTWRFGNEIGEGTIVGDDLQARWTGGGSATGRVTRRNAQGAPTQLTWSNGVVMSR